MTVCEICGRRSVIQKSGAHRHGGKWAMRAPKKRAVWSPNLQRARVLLKGSFRRVWLCTKCLKKLKKGNRVWAPKPADFSETPQEVTLSS